MMTHRIVTLRAKHLPSSRFDVALTDLHEITDRHWIALSHRLQGNAMPIIDVVKWDGDARILAFKYSRSDLSTLTQLIVNETQQAFVVREGVVDGPFPAGRHVLSTENLPLLRHILKLPFGGETPFTAEVWFVNRVVNLDVKWGTLAPIHLQDPQFGVVVPVRAFGQYGIQVIDARRFLLKLVGTVTSFDAEKLAEYFRGVFITRITSHIATTIVRRGISVLKIATELNSLSNELTEQLQPEVSEYGVRLVQFNIHSINFNETDPAILRLREALARRAEVEILGMNYQQVRSFDVLESAATNEGVAGSAAALGLGAGLGLNVASAVARIARDVNVSNPQPSECDQRDDFQLPSELEHLIQMVLADGEITEKERATVLKKAETLGLNVDEVEIILDGRLALMRRNRDTHR
jgi:membrane protease subunit (stomatin/prohibitin family)